MFELRVQRVHVHPYLLMDGHADRIDPDKWSPLIMSFQKFYGLTPHQVHRGSPRFPSARIAAPISSARATRACRLARGGSGVERDGKHVGATTAYLNRIVAAGR